MPLAAQGGWKPAPSVPETRDAGMPTGGSPDGGDRIKPSLPGDIPANPNSVR